MRVLITVKTYPIPSSAYGELVCTAGVLDTGEFIRLYPVNFRDLPYSQQYQKYQWIDVDAVKHVGRDVRKESYRPNCDTLKPIGMRVGSENGTWAERSKYVLKRRAASIEELRARQEEDRTSLGIFRPKLVHDFIVEPDTREWKPSFRAELVQARLWEDRTESKEPPRKVPFKFSYRFACDDPTCKGDHCMMIEDWEVGALYWKLRDKGASESEATSGVKRKFLDEICSPRNDLHFYVGTIAAHPKSWVIIGTFWPRKAEPSLFDPT